MATTSKAAAGMGDGDWCPVEGHGRMYVLDRGRQWCPHQSHDEERIVRTPVPATPLNIHEPVDVVIDGSRGTPPVAWSPRGDGKPMKNVTPKSLDSGDKVAAPSRSRRKVDTGRRGLAPTGSAMKRLEREDDREDARRNVAQLDEVDPASLLIDISAMLEDLDDA